MKLISSCEAVNFLSQAAPRPWVHRLLRWMALDEGLLTYARSGKVYPYTYVYCFTMQHREQAGELFGPKLDEIIRKNFSPEWAEKLVGKDPHARIYDEPTIWEDTDEPRVLDIGFFLFASELDFDKGILKAERFPNRGEMAQTFFPDDELLGTQFDEAEFTIEFSGLSFEFSKIEMLLPSMELRHSTGFTTDKPERNRSAGRPPKWDWEGAMAFVISEAQKPDGLPTGAGAQARIEEMISGWFMEEAGDAPASSQVRQRAAKIMETLETPKKPKT